jgi:hypothetical protein
VILDVALLLIGVVGLAYCLVRSRAPEPARRRGTALRRTHGLYLVGAAAACLLIAGALANLLGN